MENLTKTQIYALKILVEDELERYYKLRDWAGKKLKTYIEIEAMTYEDLLKILNESYYGTKNEA